MSSLLPDDIVVDILLRLWVKSLIRFRCVCKTWCNLISSDPNFVKMHYNHGVEKERFSFMLKGYYQMHSSIDYYDSSITSYESVEIHYPFKSPVSSVTTRGSCNGLFCIQPFSSTDPICLWNPSTKEYKKIPWPRDEYPSHLVIDHGRPTYGFGYDCNNDDYKVIRVLRFYGYVEDDDDKELCYGSEVKVYTLGSNSWKRIPFIYPYDLHYPVVLVNGALHWKATPWKGESEASDVIVSFDLGDESLIEVSPPEHLDNDFFKTVGALGGCLCISGESYSDGFVVWVMKDYGVRESWTKLFTIAQHSLLGTFVQLSPIRSFKNGEVLLNVLSQNPNNNGEFNYALVLYDPKRERVRTRKISGREWYDAETYVESLVSLNTGTYVGRDRVEEAVEKMKKLKMRKRKNKKNKKKLIYVTVFFETRKNGIPTILLSNEK